MWTELKHPSDFLNDTPEELKGLMPFLLTVGSQGRGKRLSGENKTVLS